MTELLNEMETTLSDLMQSGLATGSTAAAAKLKRLAQQCEDTGLHTGSALLSEIEEKLTSRGHSLDKDDLPLAAAICRTVHYIRLCREKLQEETITARWQSLTAAPKEVPHEYT